MWLGKVRERKRYVLHKCRRDLFIMGFLYSLVYWWCRFAHILSITALHIVSRRIEVNQLASASLHCKPTYRVYPETQNSSVSSAFKNYHFCLQQYVTSVLLSDKPRPPYGGSMLAYYGYTVVSSDNLSCSCATIQLNALQPIAIVLR